MTERLFEFEAEDGQGATCRVEPDPDGGWLSKHYQGGEFQQQNHHDNLEDAVQECEDIIPEGGCCPEED